MQSEQINELVKALISARKEFKPIQKSGYNPHFGAHFATLRDYQEATEAALLKNNICTFQEISGTNVVTTLYHVSGQFKTSMSPIKAIKEDPQAFGSAVTYARRYDYSAILFLAPEEEDDDAETAMGRKKAQGVANTKPSTALPNRAPATASTVGFAGDYVIPFGKFKTMKIKDVDPVELADYLDWIVEQKSIKPEAQKLLQIARPYLDTVLKLGFEEYDPSVAPMPTEPPAFDENQEIPF